MTSEQVSKHYELSLIICTRNRCKSLEKTLAAMGKLDIKGLRLELVVVDNGSNDSTAAVIESAANRLPFDVLCVQEKRAGLSYARNAGLAASTGAIIAFTDDDVIPASNWLIELTRPILEGRADAVAGECILAPSIIQPWMGQLHRKLLAETNFSNNDEWILTGLNMAFTRDVLSQVSGFNVNLGAGAKIAFGEDTLFTIELRAAKYRITYARDAVVVHYPDVSRLDYAGWKRRAIGEGRTHAFIYYHYGRYRVRKAVFSYVLALIKRYAQFTTKVLRHRDNAPITEAELICIERLAFYRQLIASIGVKRLNSTHARGNVAS